MSMKVGHRLGSRLILRSAFFVASILAAGEVNAYDWVATGHVAVLEATYMPGQIVFALDVQTNASSCWVAWDGSTAQGTSTNKQVDNVKAVYATLLAAKASGQKVTIYGSNPPPGSTNCVGNYIHFRD